MVILTCLLCGISISFFVGKRNISIARLTWVNLLLSVICYSYYIGYSVNELKATFCRITPNTVYFSLISVLVAILMSIVIKYKERIKKELFIKVDYNITTLDKELLLAILILAFVVRIVGVNWGDGVTFHPDEGNLVRPPISMAENNTFISDETLYPTQITSKILSIIYKIWMLIGDIFEIEITDLSYVCIARTYIAILSAGIIACIFFIGNYVKKHAGTAAAVLAAVFPPFVQAAHCVTGDTFVALCLCLTILCAFHYFKGDNDLIWLFLMSLLAVLATLDKYHGMIVCGIIAMAVFIKQIRNHSYGKIITQGCIAILVVILAAMLIVPNLFLNAEEVLKSIFHLTNDYEEGATFWGNVYTYVVWFFSHAGILCLVPIITGIIYLVRNRNIESAVLGIGFAEIFIICFQNRHYIRWGYPFYIVLFILAGIGIVWIKEVLNLKYNRYINLLFWTVTMLLWLNGMAGTLLVDALYTNSQLDTRSVSEEWCMENEIVQDDCIYDHYTCWSPGGMVYPHKWRFGMSLAESIEQENNKLIVNHLGKKYAVANLGGKENGILDENGIEKVAFFRADYLFSDSAFGGFGNISAKIFEPYSIYYCVDRSIDILENKICFGNNMAIYDISRLDSYENYPYESFESEENSHGLTYLYTIDSIFKGRYKVTVSGKEKYAGRLILETETGERVVDCELINGACSFSLNDNYYGLKMKLLLESEFESVRIDLQ